MSTFLMLLSQRRDPSRSESYNLIKMCKCVDFFWQRVDELLCMILLSSLFSLDVDYLSPSSFSLTCLVGMWHTFFGYASFSLSLFFDMPFRHVASLLWVCIFYFIIFLQSTSLMVTLERKSHGMSWSFILWVDDNVCYLPLQKYSM